MTRLVRPVLVVLLGVVLFVAPGVAAYAYWSTTATGTLSVGTVAAPVAPNAPTSFFCTDLDDTARADLTWNAVAGAASYRIYEVSGGNHFLRRGAIATASASNLTRTEGAGPNLNDQVLVVRAVGGNGLESTDSNQVVVDYNNDGSCGAPAAPTNLTHTVTVCGEATVSWNAVPNASSYVVSWNGGGPGAFTDLAPAVSGTSMTVTQAQSGGDETIQVRVRAINQAGSSTSGGPGGTLAVDFRPVACDPPGTPSRPSQSTSSCGTLVLNWNDVANATGYRVYRRISSSSYTLLADVTASDATINQGSLPTTMTVVVTAYNAAGESGYSQTRDVTITACPPPPVTPVISCGSSQGGQGVYRITWTNRPGESYDVFAAFTNADNDYFLFEASETSPYDAAVPSSTVIFGRIKATNAAGTSAWSNTLRLTRNGNGATSCTPVTP